MTEPNAPFDPRLTAARPDLAAERLRGKVEAARFVAGELQRIVAPSAPLRRRPEPDAPLETEALHGEAATVYDEAGGWSWAQLVRDSYVGYLPTSTLGPWQAPTHRVAALRTHAYPGPSIKRPPRFAISLGAWLRIERIEGDFAVAADGLHYFARHLEPASSWEPDFVAVAEQFLDSPYLWGGRTSEGVDCSGLMQAALTAAGVAAPRDSDMQEARLGSPLPPDVARRPEARRSRLLEGPRRRHARRREFAARERLAHEGRQRTAARSRRADRRQRRRPDHVDPQALRAPTIRASVRSRP